MPDVNELKNRLKQIAEEVRARLPEVAVTVVMTAKALAERRIKDKGFAEMYSENKIPAFFLHGKELNQRGTKFLQDRGVGEDGSQGEGKKKRRKKKGDPEPGNFDTMTNWKEFRQAQGLQVSFVDLSYSNKMFANMGVVNIKVYKEIVRAFLGATNREAQDKMNYNRDRYGDFISKAITEDDRGLLTETAAIEVSKIIDQLKF